MKRSILSLILVAVLVVSLANISAAAKKKVLFIDSYHVGYAWSDGVSRGVLGALNVTMNEDGTVDDSASNVALKILRMDTKRNTSEEFKQEAALQAKAEIESWKPDVVIASDDNASKYLIVPYLKDTELPVVFCAVNWDASEYGFPAQNVTGMVEISLIPQILETLKPYAKGDRIGYLAPDNLTNRKYVTYFKNLFQLDVLATFVTSFTDWKTAFEALQSEVDILLLGNAVFSDWDDQAAIAFVEANTKLPTGCYDDSMTPFSLAGYTKIPEEQGEWAAKTALKILDGTSPADIPVVTNKKGQIYLNMRLAEKLGIRFPLKIVKRATLIK